MDSMQLRVNFMYVKVYLFGLLMLITAVASAQTNSVNASADRSIISEGTTATIVIESSLTQSVMITPSIMDGAADIVLSSLELTLNSGASLVSFKVVVQDNDQAQAGNETFTVQFDVQPAIVNVNPPALTFTIPPNDLTAVVPQPAELRIATTRQTVIIDLEPPLSGSKRFTVFLTGSGIIFTTDMIISASPPPIDVALKEDNLLGPEELLNLTIHHIDTYQPLTAQAQITASDNHTCAIRSDNTVACWGNKSSGRTDLTSSPDPSVTTNTKFLAIDAGRAGHTCGITVDNRAVCWGNNGQQRSNPLDSPHGVDANTKFLAVGGGSFQSCGLKADSTVACWGSIDTDNTGHPTRFPNIDANTRFLAITVGSAFGCGIKTDGRVACWGDNGHGQRDLSSSPDPSVGPDTKFLTISAGGRHICGIKTDGRAACWGRKREKQSEPYRSPHNVNANTRFLAVTASTGACGIKTDGTVACWGSFRGDRQDPLEPGDSPHNVNENTTRFLAVSAGGDHSCGIRADSTVAC